MDYAAQGRALTNFVYVTISTGIGGGIVSEGRLLRGRLGLAGHIGHIPIKPDGGAICFCGQPGCWEAEASGSALAGEGARGGLCRSRGCLFARRGGGGPRRSPSPDAAAADIALGLAAVIHVLSPERIVIGGGVANALPVLGPMLRRHVDARVLPPFRGVGIMPAALGDDSGLAGAAQLVLRPEYAAV